MDDLLAKIAKKIVKYPNQVEVNEINSNHTILLEIAVAQKDIELIIGRKRQTIDAIRTIMRGAAGKINKRIVVRVVEDSISSSSSRERLETEPMIVSA